MATPRKSGSEGIAPPLSPEIILSFGAGDTFTGTLRCKFSISQERLQNDFPTNLLSLKMIPLSEIPPKTTIHSVLEAPIERSQGTLDFQTIHIMLTSMKAVLLLQDPNESTRQFIFTPVSSKRATLSVVLNVNCTSPTKRRMLDAKDKWHTQMKKQKSLDAVVGNHKNKSTTHSIPFDMSPMAWLQVIRSDGNFRPLSLSELKVTFDETLRSGNPTPATFVTQILPMAILGDMLPKCAAEIQVSKRLVLELVSGPNALLLDDTSMYELVSTKTNANKESLLRQVQLQALMRLQLYCMASDVWLEVSKVTKKASSKRVTKRREANVSLLSKHVLVTQVTTVLSFSSFLLDSSQPFDAFLIATIPPSVYCSIPDVMIELFDFFEVTNPFLTMEQMDDKSIVAVVTTPAKAKKGERVKFAKDIDDSSRTKAISAKKKEREEKKERSKTIEKLEPTGLSNSQFGHQERDREKVDWPIELIELENSNVSTLKEQSKEKKERRKSGDGKSPRQKSGKALLTSTLNQSSKRNSLVKDNPSLSQKSGDCGLLQKSSSGESSTLASSLELSTSFFLSTKKNSFVKDGKPRYVGSHFVDNISPHYVQAPVARSSSVERSHRKSVERSRSTERHRPSGVVKKAVTGLSPSKHKYGRDRLDTSRSPRRALSVIRGGLTLGSPEIMTRPRKLLVAETPEGMPSKVSKPLESPSAMRHISFDTEPRIPPFMTRSNSRGRAQEQKSSSAKELLQEALAARRANREKFESSYSSLR